MRTYTTKQGDTWNSVAYDVCGAERNMGPLLMANRPYRYTLIFPAGVQLNIPDELIKPPDDLPFWRKT